MEQNHALGTPGSAAIMIKRGKEWNPSLPPCEFGGDWTYISNSLMIGDSLIRNTPSKGLILF